jgi:hypothetical protein
VKEIELTMFIKKGFWWSLCKLSKKHKEKTTIFCPPKYKVASLLKWVASPSVQPSTVIPKCTMAWKTKGNMRAFSPHSHACPLKSLVQPNNKEAHDLFQELNIFLRCPLFTWAPRVAKVLINPFGQWSRLTKYIQSTILNKHHVDRR